MSATTVTHQDEHSQALTDESPSVPYHILTKSCLSEQLSAMPMRNRGVPSQGKIAKILDVACRILPVRIRYEESCVETECFRNTQNQERKEKNPFETYHKLTASFQVGCTPVVTGKSPAAQNQSQKVRNLDVSYRTPTGKSLAGDNF